MPDPQSRPIIRIESDLIVSFDETDPGDTVEVVALDLDEDE